MVNPFPLARGRRGRADAHHNPTEPSPGALGAVPAAACRDAPHHIPEDKFSELFAALGSHRDRALVAFWVSTGARASELLGASCRDADPGQQLITVIRKGTRHLQQLPASPDAFVWLRLYQAQMHGLVPAGPDDPLWWTLRRPFRALGYQRAYRMFPRASAAWAPTGLCMTCATWRPTGWPATRECRWATCSGSWGMPSSRLLSSTCAPAARGHRERWLAWPG